MPAPTNFATTLERVAKELNGMKIGSRGTAEAAAHTSSGDKTSTRLLKTNLLLRDASKADGDSTRQMRELLSRLEQLSEDGITANTDDSRALLKKLDALDHISKTVLSSEKEQKKYTDISREIQNDLKNQSGFLKRTGGFLANQAPMIAQFATSMLGHPVAGMAANLAVKGVSRLLTGKRKDKDADRISTLVDFVQKIQDESEDSGDFVEKISENQLPIIGGDIKAMRGSLHVIADQLGDGVGKGGTEEVTVAPGAEPKKKKSMLSGLLDGAMGMFKGGFGGIVKSMAPLLLGFAKKGLMTFLKHFPLIAIFGSLIDGIIDGFKVWQKTGSIGKGLMAVLSTLANDMIRIVTFCFLNLKDIQDFVSKHNLFDPIFKFFGWIWDVVTYPFIQDWKLIKKVAVGVSKGFHWIGNFFGGLGGKFKEWMTLLSWKNMKTMASGFFDALVGSVKSFFGTTISGIMSSLGIPSSYIRKVLSKFGLNSAIKPKDSPQKPISNPDGLPFHFNTGAKTDVQPLSPAQAAADAAYNSTHKSRAATNDPTKVLTKAQIETASETDRLVGLDKGSSLAQLNQESGFRDVNGKTNTNGTTDIGMAQINNGGTLAEARSYAVAHGWTGHGKDGVMDPHNTDDALMLQRAVLMMKKDALGPGATSHQILARYNGTGQAAENYANGIGSNAIRYSNLDGQGLDSSSQKLAAGATELANTKDSSRKAATAPVSVVSSQNVDARHNSTYTAQTQARPEYPPSSAMWMMAQPINN